MGSNSILRQSVPKLILKLNCDQSWGKSFWSSNTQYQLFSNSTLTLTERALFPEVPLFVLLCGERAYHPWTRELNANIHQSIKTETLAEEKPCQESKGAFSAKGSSAKFRENVMCGALSGIWKTWRKEKGIRISIVSKLSSEFTRHWSLSNCLPNCSSQGRRSSFFFSVQNTKCLQDYSGEWK